MTFVGGLPLNQIAASSAAATGGEAIALHPAAEAWGEAIVANGGSVSEPTLIAASKEIFEPLESLQPKIRQLLLLSGGNLNAARTAAYGPAATMLNFVSGDYNESTGLIPGAGKAIASNVDMSGVTLRNNGIFIYGTGLIDPAQYWMLGGSIDAAITYSYRLTNAFGELQGRNGSSQVTKANQPLSNGALTMTGTATDTKLYENDIEVRSFGIPPETTSITLAPYYLARNNNGAPDFSVLSTARLMAAAFTHGLNGVEVSMLYNAIRSFNLAIARIGAP